jgi:FRG domain
MYTVSNFKTVEQFDELISSLDSRWIFRGQASAEWPLATTADRQIQAPDKFIIEQHLLEDFHVQARHHLGEEQVPRCTHEALALMQHYGGATRLLDFSLSPHIALYFACQDVDNPSKQIAVFAINYWQMLQRCMLALRGDSSSYMKIAPSVRRKIEKEFDLGDSDQFNSIFLSPFQRNIVGPIKPTSINLRLEPQNGLFLAQGNINASFESNLQEISKVKLSDDLPYIKITLPSKLRLQILDRLDRMGIKNSRLFPGLEGFVKGQMTKLRIDYLRSSTFEWESKYAAAQNPLGHKVQDQEWNFKLTGRAARNPYDGDTK